MTVGAGRPGAWRCGRSIESSAAVPVDGEVPAGDHRTPAAETRTTLKPRLAGPQPGPPTHPACRWPPIRSTSATNARLAQPVTEGSSPRPPSPMVGSRRPPHPRRRLRGRRDGVGGVRSSCEPDETRWLAARIAVLVQRPIPGLKCRRTVAALDSPKTVPTCAKRVFAPTIPGGRSPSTPVKREKVDCLRHRL